MVFNKRNKVRMLSGMIATSLAMLMVLSASTPVLAQGANTPTLNVGDSAYFGGIIDIGEDYKAEMNEALKEFKDMGFDIKADANGGAGAYFGWEVVSNSADINGHTCYDIALTGGVGVDFGVDASVKGSYNMGEWGGVVSADGKGNAVLKFEATLEGNLYLTVDKLAIAKLQLTLKADGNFKASVDATMTAMGETTVIDVNAESSINNVQFSLLMNFDPPIALFDFPLTQGESWYVPKVDTHVTGTVTASGTVSMSAKGTVTGEPPIDERESENLAVEIGTEIIDDIIPGGAPDYYWGYGGGTLFTCTRVVGNVATVEMDMFGMMDPFYGTRQYDMFDPTGMMPDMGMQVDTTKGMPMGMTMDGEPMTETVSESDVDNFVKSPQKAVTSATGGAGGGMGGLLLIIVVVVVLVAVILVVVMVAKKKKTPPPQQYPPQQEMQQPMYGPQPGYEQPPPEYQPPPEQPQPGDYPPPPPPPGQ